MFDCPLYLSPVFWLVVVMHQYHRKSSKRFINTTFILIKVALKKDITTWWQCGSDFV